MALADYYMKGAVAASQVLAGFDESRIRTVLDAAPIRIIIGKKAAHTFEGKASIDLLTRILSRFYTSLYICIEDDSQDIATEAMHLARRINPNIDDVDGIHRFEIAIGDVGAAATTPRIYIGSNNWRAFISTTSPQHVGPSRNPFGAGLAACIGAANLFRLLFLGSNAQLDQDVRISAFSPGSSGDSDPQIEGTLGDIVLVGTGAIGNAAAWALSKVPANGLVHLVDSESLDLGNIQRYVLSERDDEGTSKVQIAGRHFVGDFSAEEHSIDLAGFLSMNGYRWPLMLLAVDSAHARRAGQASLPRMILNSWTQPGDLGVSSHAFLTDACVACLYLPDHAVESADVVIAAALGLRDQIMEVRKLLHTSAGVSRDLLQIISRELAIPIERLLPFESRPLRDLYTEGFCGGAVLPLGSLGAPREEVHVPLAHQSALAGVLLAAGAARSALGLAPSRTTVTRINVLAALPESPTQFAGKEPRGICMCQDREYVDAFSAKYSPWESPSSRLSDLN